MQKTILLLLTVLTLLSCGQTKKKINNKVPHKTPETTVYFDTLSKVYYDYTHKITFDAPDHWLWECGTGGDGTFRAYQPDSAIGFRIKANKLKEPLSTDLWDIHEKEQKEIEALGNMFPWLSDLPLEDLELGKMFLKGKKALKGRIQYQPKGLDFAYSNTLLLYQVYDNQILYNFSLHVPTPLYKEHTAFYNSFIGRISFFFGEEEMHSYKDTSIDVRANVGAAR